MGICNSLSRIRNSLILPASTAFLCSISPSLFANPIVHEVSPNSLSSSIDFVSSELPSAVTGKCQTGNSSVQFSAVITSFLKSQSEDGVRWRLENEGIAGVDGMPDLPAISRLVIVPDDGSISLSYSVSNQSRRGGNKPALFHNDEESNQGNYRSSALEKHGVWPPEAAFISKPMIWRGFRLVNLVMYPVQWDSENNEYILNQNFTTNISRSDGQGSNEVKALKRERCRDFDLALKALVINPIERDDADEVYLPGSYLVVANEDYPESVNSFIEWKRQSGHRVELLTFDPVVIEAPELKNRIADLYNENPFSFLVFIGNEEVDPPLMIPYDNEFYDNYFGQLEGDDPIADVAVGTYNCLDAENLACAIARTISYEKNPDIEDNDWFTRGFVGVGHCSVPEDLSPSYSGKWVKSVLEREGFRVASTFFSDNQNNDFSPDVADQYNAGVNMIIVRGHQSDLRPDDIHRRGVYPFHFMVSSSTISVNGWGSFNQTFRVGTSEDMRGPSAGFGHYPSPRTNIANAIVGGLIEGLYLKDIKSFGWARQYLTAKIPVVMPAEQGQILTRYWGTLRYYGDPGQEPWNGVPEEVTVDGANLWMGQSALQVRVHQGDRGVAGASVTLYDPDNFQITTVTDESGLALFNLENPIAAGQQPILTVTGDGIYPFQRQIDPRDGVQLVVTDYEVYDATNNEEELNPGDQIGLRVTYTNIGDGPSMADDDVWGYITPLVSGNFVRIQVPELGVGQSTTIEFQPDEDDPPRVAANTPDLTTIESTVRNGFNGISFEVFAPDLVVDQINGDMRNFRPGGAGELNFDLFNQGRRAGIGIHGTLTAVSEFVTVMNGAANWEDVNPGNISAQDANFSFSIDDRAISGDTVHFTLNLNTDSRNEMIIPVAIPMVAREAVSPVGPDTYGYIAIEDGDDANEWADPPEYNWVNISPWGGEFQGEALNFPVQGELDQSLAVDLPFRFRYYGEDFQQITICNNGWIAMGDQIDLKNQQNWPLPGYDGAFGMIAPFWDRLEMQSRSDGVFTYSDQQNGRFIIQWQTGVNDNGGEWAPNAFQVVLYDPDQYQTASGDSPFLFQYETVNDVQGDWEANFRCSVGISSPDGRDGITYSYWGRNPPGSNGLENRRTIWWTTVAWEPLGAIEGTVVRYIDSLAVSNATVRTSNGLRTSTNNAGEFRIVAPAVQDLTLSVRADHYRQAAVENIDIVGGETTREDFVLAHGWLGFAEDTLHFQSIVDMEWTARGYATVSNPGNLTTRYWFELDTSDNAHWNPRIEISHAGFGDTLSIDASDTLQLQFTAFCDTSGEYSAKLIVRTDTPLNDIALPIAFHFAVSVAEDHSTPYQFRLAEPFPNPFNSQTSVDFEIASALRVRIILTDIAGKEVRRVIDRQYGSGIYRTNFNAGDLPTGLYLLRMEAGQFRATQRLLLLK